MALGVGDCMVFMTVTVAGWGMESQGVWLGYVITAGWCLVFLGFTVLIGRLNC